MVVDFFQGSVTSLHMFSRVLQQGELQSVKMLLEDTKQRVDSQLAEQQNLQRRISDMESEKIQQKKQLDQVKEECGQKDKIKRD